VDQAGARLVADAGCGYGGFAVFVARQAPTLSVDGYTLSDVQRFLRRPAKDRDGRTLHHQMSVLWFRSLRPLSFPVKLDAPLSAAEWRC
jgi:hypothetical protein